MSDPTLPDIGTLTSLPISAQHDVVDTLFEPSDSLHDLAAALFAQRQQQQQSSYTSYPQFIDEVRSRLSELAASDGQSDRTTLFDILGSHPRLGEKSQNKLSALSRKEQANLRSGGQDEGQDNTEAELKRLNGVYEETFPGLRYVVFVNGRGRDFILQDMRRRIGRGDANLEVSEIIQAMCDIAADRARKLQAQAGTRI